MEKMKETLDELLIEVGIAYEQSDIRKLCLEEGYEWHYSLITTSMKPNKPLVLGFNWGASDGEKYEPQFLVNKSDFSKEDVGSLARIFPYCEKYFGNDFLSDLSQSNYCFFRSYKEHQVSDKDIQLCEPILSRLIDAISPSLILCFSSKLRDYLIANSKLSSTTSKVITYKRGTSTVSYAAIKGVLAPQTEIKFLPHPNYPMKGEARSEAWEFCCG